MTLFARRHQTHIEGMVLGILVGAVAADIGGWVARGVVTALLVSLAVAYSAWEPRQREAPAKPKA